ncbi:unnamed protein product [Closterium sp. NIES-54]
MCATSLSSSARLAARRAPSLPPPFRHVRPILLSRAPSFSLLPAPRPSPARPSAPLVARRVHRCRAPPPPPCAPFCILLFAITTPLYEIRLFIPLLLLSLPSFPLQPPPFLRLLSCLSCSSWLLISPGGCASLHSSPLYQDPSPHNPPLHRPPPLLSLSFPLPISLSPPPLSSLHLPQLVADLVSSSCSGAAADYSAHIPLPLISPLSCSAADYSVPIPLPLISPLSGAAADYSAHIPPLLISPLSFLAADYSVPFPPPLISPLSGAAEDYSAHIPPPLISPLSRSASVSFPSYGAHSYDSLSSSPLLPSPSYCCPSSLTPPSPTLCVIRSPLSHLDHLSHLPLDLSSVSFLQSHLRLQPPAPPSLSVATPGANAFPYALSVTMPSYASILGASPLMYPRFAVPFLPSAPSVVSPYPYTTVAALSLSLAPWPLSSTVVLMTLFFVMPAFFVPFPALSLFMELGRP